MSIEELPPLPEISGWMPGQTMTPPGQEWLNALKRQNEGMKAAIEALQAANETAAVEKLASGIAWYDKTVNAWSTNTAVTSAVSLGYGLTITPGKQDSKIRFVASFLLYPGTGVNTNITVKLLVNNVAVETQTTIAGAWYCVPQLVFEYSPQGQSKTYDIEISASGTTNMHPGGSTFLAAQELEAS